MVVEVSVAIIAGAIFVSAIFLIILLISIVRTFRHARRQMESFDSMLRSVSNVGDILEQSTDWLKERVQKSCCQEKAQDDEISNKTALVLALAVFAVSLWQMMKKSQRS